MIRQRRQIFVTCVRCRCPGNRANIQRHRAALNIVEQIGQGVAAPSREARFLSEVEGDLQSDLQAIHDLPVELALDIAQACLADGSHLLANNNPVDGLPTDSGWNVNMAGINSLLVTSVGNRTYAHDRAVLVEGISAHNYNPPSAPLFGALDRIQNGDKDVTARDGWEPQDSPQRLPLPL